MKITYVLMFFLFIAACNRNPYSTTNKQYRKQAKEFAKIIKQAPPADSLNRLVSWVGTTTEVSAHYVICRDGTVTQMLNDYLRAWHAGAGKWGNLSDINSSSIGIELDNNGGEPFPEIQVNNLLILLESLK